MNRWMRPKEKEKSKGKKCEREREEEEGRGEKTVTAVQNDNKCEIGNRLLVLLVWNRLSEQDYLNNML